MIPRLVFTLVVLLAGAASPAAPGSAAASPAAPDSTPAPRVVRRFEAIEVHAQLHDLLSTETVHLVPATSLRVLPADRLADVLAVKAGVVARGEELHVRGGRAGETRVLLEGVELNDPLRGSSMELPLTSLRSADLVTGGLDAEHGGALAGVIELRTVDPGPRWSGELQWQTDGALYTRYDRAAGRAGGPIGQGLGVVASADALLDGTTLPSLRDTGRRERLGVSLGWRANNRLLGHLKVAPIGGAGPWSLQLAASRRVVLPYDPMWSFDGYFSFCPDPPLCDQPPTASTTPLPDGERYRAADHHTMTDELRGAAILTAQRSGRSWRATSSLGWTGLQSITSLNGRDDGSYIADANAPIWGTSRIPGTDPFRVFFGDEPYFRRARSEAWTLRASVSGRAARNVTAKVGVGATHERAALFELDDPNPGLVRVDSLRSFDASAPGGFAFAQGRWDQAGMVVTGGARLQYFTAGPDGHTRDGVRPPSSWTVSPRLGLTYPLSVRDAFSLSYTRLYQQPARNLLYDDRTLQLSIVNRRPEGNGTIRPTEMISYQMAVKHLFDASWATQLSLFYRDLFGLPGIQDGNPSGGVVRLQYAGKDEGHAAGFEVSLFHADAERLRSELHYTFLNAWGTQSDPEGTMFGPPLRDRLIPIGEHPLDWDIRHVLTLSLLWQRPGAVSLSWITALRSGAPWTAAERRVVETDQTAINGRRLPWSENSSLAARWQMRALPGLWFGLDVRNVFDWRGDVAATLDGHPHPRINSLYDDYGAFRTETGLGGGGYFEDVNGDGVPEWTRVHDPRLANAPRSARLMAGARW